MVIWTNPAKADLKRLYRYIEQDSKYYANEVAERIIELVEKVSFLSE